MLTVSRLTAGYGAAPVIRDITFELDNGFTVLLGQNGSGKTTLFRALSGSIRPESGRVLLDGEDLLRLSAKQRARRIAQVTGSHQTLAGITGADLAEMALYPAHGPLYRPGKADREKIAEAAATIGSEALLARPLDKMSAGERQLMELTAAFCQNTPVLLLDEPTSALDYNRTHSFLSKAGELSAGRILLATLHDPALALSYADRILLLQDGTVEGDFSPAKTDEKEAEAFLRILYPQIRVIRCESRLTVLNA